MALKTFVTGEVLTASDVNRYLVNTITVRKTSTESVTSSTTLQDDDQLTASVEANRTYEVVGQLIFDGGTTGDLKFIFAVPTSAALYCVITYPTQLADTTIGGNATITFVDSTIETHVGTIGLASTQGLSFTGLLAVAGTAGTFKLRWAQEVSSGTATRLGIGSYFSLREVE